MTSLDDVERSAEISARIRGKASLVALYREIYGRYASCLSHCPRGGLAVELGSGSGFTKECVPEILTTDILPYPSVDRVVDATRMPFRDGELRGLFLLNTFHHIPDVETFLSEAVRCLQPNGRVLIVDQYPGWPARWIFKYLHHEPFDPKASSWSFDSRGPLSGANGALCWIVFCRDRQRFADKYPQLRIERFERHTPFRYWLIGGLKPWSLLPRCLFSTASRMDRFLARLLQGSCSFVDVELVRTV